LGWVCDQLIAEHDEDRVVVLADPLQVVDEPSDVEVEVLDHSCVQLHLLAEDGPGRRRQHDGVGNEPHALGEFRGRRHDPKLDLALQALLPHRVPALVVLADVAISPFARQLIWIVRRLVGDIGEKGLAVAAIGVDETDQPVGVGLRCVVILWEARQIATVLGEDRFRRGGREIRRVPVAARSV
jgi:hypothetical protein